jgi:hypothetical protein
MAKNCLPQALNIPYRVAAKAAAKPGNRGGKRWFKQKQGEPTAWNTISGRLKKNGRIPG